MEKTTAKLKGGRTLLDNQNQENTRYFSFTGAIEPNSATRIAAAFNQAVIDGFGKVYLCLSSGGGLVADGIYLYNHIRSLPLDVTTHNMGSVASIATAVYVAGGKRFCSTHGVFMLHPTAMNTEQGNMQAETLQSLLRAALAEDQRTEDILRERTSIPDDTLQDRRFREVYITSQEAVKFGLCDAVCDFSLPRGNEIFQV